jgi:hypothetical protein
MSCATSKKNTKSPRVAQQDSSSREARRVAAAVLEVLAGLRTPTEAAQALAISIPRYYTLEQRALAGLVVACEPRRRGGGKRPQARIEELERQVQRLQQQCDRHLALARAAGRTVGLSMPPKSNRKQPKVGGNKASSIKTRRRRRPTVRALKVARSLGDSLKSDTEECGAENGPATTENPSPQGE